LQPGHHKDPCPIPCNLLLGWSSFHLVSLSARIPTEFVSAQTPASPLALPCLLSNAPTLSSPQNPLRSSCSLRPLGCLSPSTTSASPMPPPISPSEIDPCPMMKTLVGQSCYPWVSRPRRAASHYCVSRDDDAWLHPAHPWTESLSLAGSAALNGSWLRDRTETSQPCRQCSIQTRC
jgi:hypothetical protein